MLVSRSGWETGAQEMGTHYLCQEEEQSEREESEPGQDSVKGGGVVRGVRVIHMDTQHITHSSRMYNILGSG